MLDSERTARWKASMHVEDKGSAGAAACRVASGRHIAVVEERQTEQFANRGYDVLTRSVRWDPSVTFAVHRHWPRGYLCGKPRIWPCRRWIWRRPRRGDQAAETTPDGFTFYGGAEPRRKSAARCAAARGRSAGEADPKPTMLVIMGHRMSDLNAIGSAENCASAKYAMSRR